jgi:asparagine synthase (glutamine-hydrolysing)
MCGVAGVARFAGNLVTGEAEPLVRRMVSALRHRGPDEERVLLDERVALAFARLSLVDPTGGGQPLVSADGTVVLIANGEIYNHVELASGLPAGTHLRSRSDCEVLIPLYQRDGLRFLDRVRGMFSLVLWDRANQQLVLARDRFGIKPLFYHQNAERVVFGSEAKALFEDAGCPRQVDWQAGLTDQSMTGAATPVDGRPVAWFRGITPVPSATVVTFSLRDGRRAEHRYWTLPVGTRDDGCGDAELIDSHRELLRSAVVDACMADVEIGLFLSGGIDSAAVAAFASKELNLRTFSVLNATTMASGDAEYGHRTASALGLPNHQVLFGPDRVPSVAEWKRLLWLVEMPQCGPEQFYKYELHRFVKSEFPAIKAMLLGGGADEYNGGYTVGLSGDAGWSEFMGILHGMTRNTALLSRPELASWMTDDERPLLTDHAVELCSGRTMPDPYRAFLAWKHRDVTQYNCWHEDRTAGGNGIEARVPFLDHRLVEFLVTLPPGARERLLWDKRILRNGMVGLLPDDVVTRPKVPFYHYTGAEHTNRIFARMLAQDGGALVEEALSSPTGRDLFNADNVRAMARTITEPDRTVQVERLLRVVNLGLLDSMTHDVPTHPARAGAVAVARAVPLAEWDDEGERLASLTVRKPFVSRDSVLALHEDVLLLRGPTDSTTWYIAVDGTIRYLVDAVETPDWSRVLLAIDGERDLATVLALAGTHLDGVADVLYEALELGVVVLVDSDELCAREVAR